MKKSNIRPQNCRATPKLWHNRTLLGDGTGYLFVTKTEFNNICVFFLVTFTIRFSKSLQYQKSFATMFASYVYLTLKQKIGILCVVTVTLKSSTGVCLKIRILSCWISWILRLKNILLEYSMKTIEENQNCRLLLLFL